MRLEELGTLKKFNDHISSRARFLPACSIVPQPRRYRVPQVTTVAHAVTTITNARTSLNVVLITWLS
jgi:hypothetical protein